MARWRWVRFLIVVILCMGVGLVLGAIAGFNLPLLPHYFAGETTAPHGAATVGMFTASIGALVGAGLGSMIGIAICRRRDARR